MKVSKLAIKTGMLTIVVALSMLMANAQNRERFGISAKAGAVNAVSGKVSVRRRDRTTADQPG